MDSKKLRNILIIIMIIYTVLTASFYVLAQDQIKYYEPKDSGVIPEANSITDEININTPIEELFVNKYDRIESIALVFSKLYHTTDGNITVILSDDDENRELLRETISTSLIEENQRIIFDLYNVEEGLKNQTLTLRIQSNSTPGKGVAAMLNMDNTDEHFKIGNKTINGRLCFSVIGKDETNLNKNYWFIVIVTGVALSIILLKTYFDYRKGHINYIASIFWSFEKYGFLISQLVSRDFKSKYKRSIFGILWSFLNPLLTMTVQFLVFSTFFKTDTQNYPVYLLCGVVCFSFFSECTSMCLSSISGNSNLITKVYIPKYIFPLTRTISSSVNLAISLIPLFLACLVLGITIKPQALLFFYFIVCLVIFALGVGMLLSALMVFFRDIQFLWTVLIQIWNYATPIFYPAEIVPEKYRFILRFNPLYHFIGNARICLMNGVSPEPIAYVYSFIFAVGSFLIGSYVFKKTQDRFALYI